MQQNRRDFLIAAGAFGGSLALAPRARAQGSKVTLWDISTGDQKKLVEQTVQRFDQSHPNIGVAVDFFQNDPYKTKLRIAMGAGQPPDIFFGWGGGILESYVTSNKVVALPHEVNTTRFLDSVMSPVTFKGQVYGIPCNDTQPELFYYSKPIFAKYGITPPKTWAEMLAAVRTLRGKGVTPISLAGQNKWPGLMFAEFLVNRIGGNAPIDAVVQGHANAWSDPAIIKANKMIVELVELGAFPKDFAALNYDTGQSTQLLYGGEAAMQLMGAWDYQMILSDAPDFVTGGKLGWFPFPSVEGGTGDPRNVIGNPTNFYSMTSRAPAQAATFLNEGVLDEFETDGLIKIGLVPPLKGIRDKLEHTEHADWLLAVYDLAANAPHFDLSWDQALPPRAAQALLTNLGLLFLKELTPEEFSKQMNETMRA